MQHGMLYESALANQPWVNLQQLVVRLPEALQPETLREAWALSLTRHAALRTTFAWRGLRVPEQHVHPVGALDFRDEDWRGRAPGTREADLERLLEQDRAAGIPLDELPTMRLRLLRFADQEWVLLWTFHHALLDGRGFTLVLSEVFEDYETLKRGERPSRPPAPSFASHLQALGSTDRGEANRYFKEQLKGLEQATRLTLPAAPRRRSGPTAEPVGRAHGELETRLPREAVQRLEQVAKEAGVTFFTCVQAAWAILLSRYARTDDVVFGVTRAGRHLVPDADQIAGCLINTVPLRARVDEQQPLRALLLTVRAASISVRPFEHTALVDIQRASGLPTSEPLLTTNVVLERYLLESHLQAQGGLWRARRVRVHEQGSFPLSLAGYLDGDLLLRLEHDVHTYGEESVAGMARHLVSILEDMSVATVSAEAGEAGTLVAELRTLSDDERRALLRATLPGSPLEPQRETYPQLFARRAAQTPHALAVRSLARESGGRDTLTYAELDALSDQLAARLRACGVTRNERVAICLPRTLALTEAILAVLKAGAAYVPLDPSYPAEALRYMLADSGARVILTESALTDRLPQLSELRVPRLLVDRPETDRGGLGAAEAVATDGDAPDAGEPSAEDLAYVIYTSGSTGRPKGVMVPHRALVAHDLALGSLFELSPQDRVLQFASFSFDVAVEETLPTWLAGATLVLRSDAMSESVSEFLGALARAEITVLNLPTAFWHELVRRMDEAGARLPESVRLCVVGGEKASRRAFAAWQRLAPNVRWLNCYGPTEATVTCTSFDSSRGPALAPEREVPIGRPTANSRAYVLDSRRRLVPPGVPGQLWVGGPSVALGYLGQEALSRERFVPDPFAPGERMYATGDLARWWPTQTEPNEDAPLKPKDAILELDFLGRIDRQLKLRGFRIEPGEIEAVLETHQDVEEAVVAVRPDHTGRDILLAWVRAPHARALSSATLRKHVRTRLPAFMTPANVVILPEFPMTPGAKVDLAALPSPERTEGAAGDATRSGPRHETDRALCGLFAEALERDEVGPHESFFDLGGHSLLAVRLLDRVHEAFDKRLSLGALKAADTPAELADLLLESAEATSFEYIYPIQPEGERPPLFAVHVLGSNGSYFTPLSEALGPDQPVIGLVSPPRPQSQEVSVPEVAAAYAAEIQRYAPEGPIALAAVSLGGLVAIEVARALKQAGRHVLLVGLLDALGPGPQGELGGLARAMRHVRHLREQGPAYVREKVQDRMQKLQLRAQALELRLRRQLGVSVSDELRALEFIERNAHAALGFLPEPYPGRLTLFRATENVFYSEAYRRSGMGWSGVAEQGVEVIDVPGEHLSMLRPPHVHALAAALQSALRQAREP